MALFDDGYDSRLHNSIDDKEEIYDDRPDDRHSDNKPLGFALATFATMKDSFSVAALGLPHTMQETGLIVVSC